MCGEHGGDPSSIHFFQKEGIDYLSCSPYRIPIAKIAAAQAHIEQIARKLHVICCMLYVCVNIVCVMCCNVGDRSRKARMERDLLLYYPTIYPFPIM